MQTRKILGSCLILCLLALRPDAHPAEAKKPSMLRCSVLPTLFGRYLDRHVTYREASDELVERAVTLLADRIDPGKSLLTKSEYRVLQQRLGRIYRGALDGKCDDVSWLETKQLAWQRETEKHAKALLADPKLAIDKSIKLQLDPDKRERPATAAERDALRTKLIHFQLANLVRGGLSLDEAKGKLVKRYELATRRVSELDREDLYSSMLDAYANALDPHTSYFSHDMLEDFRIQMELSLEGIGAVLSSRDGYTVVNEVVPGGAAARQGQLRVNDKIIAVAQGITGDPVDVIDMALRDVVRQIRGKRGTKVKLTLLRQGEKTERLEVVIVRDKIDIKQQAAKLTIKDVTRGKRTLKLAIIDLPSFYGGRERNARNSAEDVKALLAQARDAKVDGVLLDLSRNGGGLLDAAVDISGLFLVKGPVVGVDSTFGTQLLADEDPQIVYTGPLVVMTSRVSASAAEILAGVMQDYHRAVVVGDDHTYGKGSVQTVLDLPPGLGALKVTQGLYYLPGGQSTQSRGVRADVVVPSPFSMLDIGEAYTPFALPARRIKAFKSDSVNGRANKHFAPITGGVVKKLVQASAKRVARVEAFRELDAARKKRTKDGGVVTIQDLFDDVDDTTKTKDDDQIEDPEDEDLSAQTTEALEVLADLATS